MTPELRKLIVWIAEHSERESILLTPHPAYYLDAHALLDSIVETFGVSKADVGAIVDEISDAKLASEKKRKDAHGSG